MPVFIGGGNRMKVLIGAGVTALIVWLGVVLIEPGAPPQTCDLNATTSNFAAQVTAATAGQTICLADGNYGTWTGVNKAITLRSAAGQGATIGLNTTGSGFTLDSLTVTYRAAETSSEINYPAHDITIRNSNFTGQLEINNTQNANILVEDNTFPFMNAVADPARLQVNCTSTSFCEEHVPAGVVVRDNYLSGGDADGLWTNTGGVTFDHNEFVDICNTGATGNHTDNIQVGIGDTAGGVTITRNLIRQTTPCQGQGLSAYDGLADSTITDNVVQMAPRPWPLEVYSDDTSTVAHNTIVSYGIDNASCSPNACGVLSINSKNGTCSPASPPTCNDAGFGTIVIDNIARSIGVENATLGQRDHNMVLTGAAAGDITGTPIFVGGADPTTYEGFCLAANSPGKNAASDGLDIGIRC